MELDKNGSYSMSIYCLRCSGGTHENMNKDKGKGRCNLIKRHLDRGVPSYDLKCKCGYINSDCSDTYVRDYAI